MALRKQCACCYEVLRADAGTSDAQDTPKLAIAFAGFPSKEAMGLTNPASVISVICDWHTKHVSKVINVANILLYGVHRVTNRLEAAVACMKPEKRHERSASERAAQSAYAAATNAAL